MNYKERNKVFNQRKILAAPLSGACCGSAHEEGQSRDNDTLSDFGDQAGVELGKPLFQVLDRR